MTDRDDTDSPRRRLRDAIAHITPAVTAREIRRPITTNDQLERLADY